MVVMTNSVRNNPAAPIYNHNIYDIVHSQTALIVGRVGLQRNGQYKLNTLIAKSIKRKLTKNTASPIYNHNIYGVVHSQTALIVGRVGLQRNGQYQFNNVGCHVNFQKTGQKIFQFRLSVYEKNRS